MRRVTFTIALLNAFLFFGCGQQANAPQTATAARSSTNSQRQVYHVRGVVREIESPKRARIEHENIPGYMEAMTMPFDVKNTNELANVKAGDKVTFDMVVTKDDGWIENVKHVGEEAVQVTGDTNQGVEFTKSRVVEPLEFGDPVPDYPFVTDEGKAIHLRDFKGQAVGITFIFTRCPFPTFCPRMTSNFEKVAAELAKPGNPTNWHLLSVSFDPDFDTPERLAEHAKKFKRDPAKWNFA